MDTLQGFRYFLPVRAVDRHGLQHRRRTHHCKVNGQPRQMASTRDMVFSVPTLIAYISSVMTLEPGDLIFTGTPAGVGALENGSEVVVEIEGLGVLRNPVKAESR